MPTPFCNGFSKLRSKEGKNLGPRMNLFHRHTPGHVSLRAVGHWFARSAVTCFPTSCFVCLAARSARICVRKVCPVKTN